MRGNQILIQSLVGILSSCLCKEIWQEFHLMVKNNSMFAEALPSRKSGGAVMNIKFEWGGVKAGKFSTEGNLSVLDIACLLFLNSGATL